MFAFLHDSSTHAEVSAERSLLQRLGGDCHVPIGARARVEGATLKMIGIVASPDGKSLCKGIIAGKATDAVLLGQQLAEQLLRDGADKILTLT